MIAIPNLLREDGTMSEQFLKWCLWGSLGVSVFLVFSFLIRIYKRVK